MKNAETVTFGGSALDRAADLRADEAALAVATAKGGARAIVLWRGKPLVQAASLDKVLRLPLDHPVVANIGAPILLGRDVDGLIFACDISDWAPEGLDEAALGQFSDETEQRHPDLPDDSVFSELRRIMARLSARDAELTATAKALFNWHDSHKFCARCGAASTMVMAGWQRSCGQCGGQHFPRTDPVVIMLITYGNSVLMGRSPGWPEGMYSALAGFVEPGETIEAAVRREAFEEAGVKVAQVAYLASQPWAFPSSLMIGCHGAAISHEITIDPVEIEDALWISREDMLLAYAGQHPVLAPARKGSIAHFLIGNWLADKLD